MAILHDVESEPTLHTPAIYTQLNIIKATGTELKQILEKMTVLQQKSALRQGLRAFVRKTEDETRLNCVLERLEKTKTDLLLRVNVAHVGITRRVTGISAHGFLTPMATNEGCHADRVPETRCLFIEQNETGDEADQLNGIGGINASKRQVTASVAGNKAVERSRQRNLILNSTNPLDFL